MIKPHADIRIGTLVSAKTGANYIKQIIPHGFESFSITFWQEIGNISVPKLAAEVREALEGHDIKISTVSMFGNPLESGELDKKTVAGWKTLIDNAHLFGAAHAAVDVLPAHVPLQVAGPRALPASGVSMSGVRARVSFKSA